MKVLLFEFEAKSLVLSFDKQMMCVMVCLPEQELREACEVDAVRFGKERLLVTAAVSGGEATIKQAYDIPALAE